MLVDGGIVIVDQTGGGTHPKAGACIAELSSLFDSSGTGRSAAVALAIS